ncbi:MAG: GFA family protein [Candidatus Marinimicrobia bacterium]|nr:GFA family protein [Candidatus Neomarinimicrobiota bacterium]
MNSKIVHGACLCEKIKFEVTLPTKWCAHCHCTLCRRSHGAAFVTWFGVNTSQFRIIKGENQIKWYFSSAESQRGFCTNCGSHILFKSTKWPGETHVSLSNMINPIDRKPAGHAYFDTHVDWLEFNDGLPRNNDPDLIRENRL